MADVLYAHCIRDGAGFCVMWLWGNPACFRKRAGAPACHGTDLEAAYRRLIQAAKRRYALQLANAGGAP